MKRHASQLTQLHHIKLLGALTCQSKKNWTMMQTSVAALVQ